MIHPLIFDTQYTHPLRVPSRTTINIVPAAEAKKLATISTGWATNQTCNTQDRLRRQWHALHNVYLFISYCNKTISTYTRGPTARRYSELWVGVVPSEQKELNETATGCILFAWDMTNSELKVKIKKSDHESRLWFIVEISRLFLAIYPKSSPWSIATGCGQEIVSCGKV